MLKIEQNKQLAASFQGLKYFVKSHNYITWMAGKILLHIPTNRTDRYGKQSPKCNCIFNQDGLSHFKLKTLTKDHIINKYSTIHETYIISYYAYILCPVYFFLLFCFSFSFPLSVPIFIMHFFCYLFLYGYILYYHLNYFL